MRNELTLLAVRRRLRWVCESVPARQKFAVLLVKRSSTHQLRAGALRSQMGDTEA